MSALQVCMAIKMATISNLFLKITLWRQVLNNFWIKVFDKILFQFLWWLLSNFCLFVVVSTKKYPVKNFGVSEETAVCRQQDFNQDHRTRPELTRNWTWPWKYSNLFRSSCFCYERKGQLIYINSCHHIFWVFHGKSAGDSKILSGSQNLTRSWSCLWKYSNLSRSSYCWLLWMKGSIDLDSFFLIFWVRLFYRKTKHCQNCSILRWLVDRQDNFGSYFLLKILTGMPKICICYGTLFGDANLYYS